MTNFPTEVDGVPTMTVEGSDANGWTVGLNICRWIDVHANWSDSHESITEKLSVWMKKFNYTYYSAPRESFNEWSAVSDARKDGFNGVVMEDLS
jgi:uncharacterized protein YodC (DUF2158 family)